MFLFITTFFPGHGWHPIDAYRLTDRDVTDNFDYHDRTGEHRPKIIFAGKEVHHTKEHHIKVKNTIGCGCEGNHDPNDERCFYNLVKTYMTDKDKSDLLFMNEDYVKLNQQTRRVHVDEEGDLRPVNFFRAMSRKGADRCTPTSRAPPPEHGRQQDEGGLRVQNETVLYWNKKLNLNPEKRLVAASARRTFCTVGDKYTTREFFDVAFDSLWEWCSSKFRGRVSWRSRTTSARSNSAGTPPNLGARR